MARGLSENFLNAMREKLEHGRQKGKSGWDSYWDCCFEGESRGHRSVFVHYLLGEVCELIIALESGKKKDIRSEAADIANYAMMIADIEGALDE